MTKLAKPFKWFGGKGNMAPHIHRISPPSVHDHSKGYTHRNIAYAGGLGETLDWHPIEGISECVNDLNSELTNFWSVLGDRSCFREFKRRAEATPFGTPIFGAPMIVRPGHRLDVDRALAFFIKYRQSRQGLGKDYATPTKRTRRGMNENISAWLTAVDGLPDIHERLRRVEIRNEPAVEFIRKLDHSRALVYADPPYWGDERAGTKEYGEFEMTEDQHEELLQTLTGIEGWFILSGYHSELYDDYAHDHCWSLKEIPIVNAASSKKTKDVKIECLWTNYEFE